MNDKNISQSYLNALLAGDRKNAGNICSSYLKDDKTIMELYENVMKPALYEVGKLWEQNKITVAAEHMATAITEGILNSYYTNIIPEKYNGKKVVLACVEKEEHQVGIKMVADVFEMNDWESFFLGKGFPTSELLSFIDEIKPEIVAISISIYFNFSPLRKMISEIKNAFPHISIIIGGQAVSQMENQGFEEWPDVTFLNDLNNLENFIKNYK